MNSRFLKYFLIFFKWRPRTDSLNPLFFFYILFTMSALQYPNGFKATTQHRASDNHARRGTSLEEDLNDSNVYYRERDIALIYKKPTPIQVVRVDYPARNKARITEAYYRTPSTTDYNGLYRGRYIDFEAKETRNKTSFPNYLVQSHQIDHLNRVRRQGGIGFFIIRFSTLGETWLVDSQDLTEKLREKQRKSIPHSWFTEHGILLEEGLFPRIAYLRAVDQKYMKGD